MIRIRARRSGPLVVEVDGPCELYGTDGLLRDTSELRRVLLCRCGASKSAPLCDGAHNRVDFERDPAPEPTDKSLEDTPLLGSK